MEEVAAFADRIRTGITPSANHAPTISVVIPARNAARFIGEAITSVLSQTAPPLEVLVVDDGSTDDTRSVVERFDGLVRYLPVPAGGPARARNAGIEAARGSHIAFLDADDSWLPDKLERQLAVLDAETDLSLVYVGWDLVDEDGTFMRTVPCQPECGGRMAAHALLIKNSIQVSGVVASREALLAAGLFDPDLPSCENWDLWIRLARLGRVGFVDAPLVRYRMRRGGRIRDVSRMRGARLEVLARYHPRRRGPTWRRALALAYLDSGIGYLELGSRCAAVADLLRSLYIRPAATPCIQLVRAVLPPTMRHSLGRARARVRGRWRAWLRAR